VSVCEGEPLLWSQDHVRGLRRDAGQEQPARAYSQHAVHCLAHKQVLCVAARRLLYLFSMCLVVTFTHVQLAVNLCQLDVSHFASLLKGWHMLKSLMPKTCAGTCASFLNMCDAFFFLIPQTCTDQNTALFIAGVCM